MHMIDEERRETSFGTPKFLVRSFAAAFGFPRRRSTPRTPLRVVSPFHHDAPLVMPDDAGHRRADEPSERGERDRGRTEKEDAREPNTAP